MTTLRPGDLAVPMVRQPCPHPECVACRAGRQDFCYTGDFRERGIKQLHGFMTEFVVDDEKHLNPVPRELREVAVLVEPLTIAEKALAPDPHHSAATALERGSNRRAAAAVVLGAGPVGLLGAMALVNAGFETYIYSREEPGDPRAGVAAAIGASYVSSQSRSIPQLAAERGQHRCGVRSYRRIADGL